VLLLCTKFGWPYLGAKTPKKKLQPENKGMERKGMSKGSQKESVKEKESEEWREWSKWSRRGQSNQIENTHLTLLGCTRLVGNDWARLAQNQQKLSICLLGKLPYVLSV